MSEQPVSWSAVGEYDDIRYELSGDGIAKITINRPEVHNAFRPQTLIEISHAADGKERKGKGAKALTPKEKASLIAQLEQEMKEASRRLEFEYAAILRDQIIELRGASETG